MKTRVIAPAVIQDGDKVLLAKDGGRFWIQDGYIYGPRANLPWL